MTTRRTSNAAAAAAVASIAAASLLAMSAAGGKVTPGVSAFSFSPAVGTAGAGASRTRTLSPSPPPPPTPPMSSARAAAAGPSSHRLRLPSSSSSSPSALFAEIGGDGDGGIGGGGDRKETERTISAAPSPDLTDSIIDLDARARAAEKALSSSPPDSAAATNTVNERLRAELEAAREGTERGPGRSELGMKIGAAFRSERTDEERRRSIEEARDLNGVNPLVALGGSVFASGMAASLWYATGYLGDLFLRHPVDADNAPYTFVRLAAVFRNVVMGLSSLAAGFAGVTGLGLLLLGVRVGYGVATGELDPTPVKKRRGQEIEMPNVWDLMLNKRPDRRGRRGGGGKGNDNPFGL